MEKCGAGTNSATCLIGSSTIIGTGPIGLTAAYEFIRHKFKLIIVETSNRIGGIARTEIHKGNLYDIDIVFGLYT